jgi:SAM-dependent methyltransferase
MEARDAGRFWDRRAGEDPFYFVDNRLDYGRPDLDRFWADGEHDLDRLLGELDARVEPGDTVLDVGCGVGRLTRVLAARARHVIALDVSARMLERARELNAGLDNVEWVLGDGRSLVRVGDASVDAAISHVVFQHIPDPAVTLGYVRELGRVLRPGGWAAFQVSTDPSVHRDPRGPVARLRARLRGGPRGQGHPAWLGSAVALDDLRAAAADGGLEIEALRRPDSQFCTVLARRGPRGDAGR